MYSRWGQQWDPWEKEIDNFVKNNFVSLTQYPNNMGTCKMHKEIETNQTKLMETKQNEIKNRNTVAMSVMSCFYNENKVWGISWYLCCNLCILIHFVAISGRLQV